MSISKKERDVVFKMFSGKCAYCGHGLTKGWHVDHFEPVVRNWWNGTCRQPQNIRIITCLPVLAVT